MLGFNAIEALQYRCSLQSFPPIEESSPRFLPFWGKKGGKQVFFPFSFAGRSGEKHL
jgi:hypothetical protein